MDGQPKIIRIIETRYFSMYLIAVPSGSSWYINCVLLEALPLDSMSNWSTPSIMESKSDKVVISAYYLF